MQHLRRTEGGEADKKLKEQLGEEEKPIEGSGHRNRQETSLKRRNNATQWRGHWQRAEARGQRQEGQGGSGLGGGMARGLSCRERAASPKCIQGTHTAGWRPAKAPEGSVGRWEESGQAEGRGRREKSRSRTWFARRVGVDRTREALSKLGRQGNGVGYFLIVQNLFKISFKQAVSIHLSPDNVGKRQQPIWKWNTVLVYILEM